MEKRKKYMKTKYSLIITLLLVCFILLYTNNVFQLFYKTKNQVISKNVVEDENEREEKEMINDK
jgi:hypothetical protein